jgi:pyridoxal phosphate enzyme (YggS family)
MTLYEKRWQAVAERISAAAHAVGRESHTIRVLAVSKGQAADAIRDAWKGGQRAFGENYVQEAAAKMDSLTGLEGAEWHLIGPLQGNKARLAAARFAWVQSIDRAAIAHKLSQARDPALPPLACCVQVNISGEAAKHGCTPEDASALAAMVAGLPRLHLRGFMGIAEETTDCNAQRAQFARLRAIFEQALERGLAVDTLSMGMSGDLEAAIAEGSTMVRVGSALFGERRAHRRGEPTPA